MKWFPLRCRSEFSLQRSALLPEQINKAITDLGYDGVALTDYDSVSGYPALKEGLKGKKSIIGMDATCSVEQEGRITILARNQSGWKKLLKVVSEGNSSDTPKIPFDFLKLFQEDGIALSGYIGSTLCNSFFIDKFSYWMAKSYEQAKQLVREDWKESLINSIEIHKKIFPKFYITIQLIDSSTNHAGHVLAKALRYIGEKTNTPCVAVADPHYIKKTDAHDQRVLQALLMKCTLKEVPTHLNKIDNCELAPFFNSNNYYFPSISELQQIHPDCEINIAHEISEMCESPDINNKPLLPQFVCPNNLSPEEYMRNICREGWIKKISKSVDKTAQSIYVARIKEELEVLCGAGLSSYFLMTRDIIKYVQNNLNALVGEGRGSAAGCLTSYLMDITDVDPIKYELLFSRFYNAARNTKDRIALPDIDTDFPVRVKDKIIDYLRDKYGSENVGQMATFQRSQGKGMIKDILRVHNRCSFEEMNKITEFIPDESKITDDLEEMSQADEEASIILWALQNNGPKLKEWCFLKDDGSLDGPLSLDFAQAIRLEGTKKSQGKHPSGIVVSSVPLNEVVPMVKDKSSDYKLIGVDMRDAEKMGLIKLDILTTVVLDKIEGATSLIRTGKL